ncbi:MAG: cohesin domain-containing protein [Saprospiraceae bacterium]|nr:cohesin domain-containing protein [Saprospiraceae bacterium]MDW8484232.1 cohesin domain-containing protein [Saprospiraceae bacterium]
MRPIFPTLLAASLLISSVATSGQSLITTFSPSSLNANYGDTITLQLKVQNFTNIASLQFPITFNNTLLEFVSLTTTTLPGFTAANYNVQPGKVTVSWFPDAFQYPNGLTLANNSTLLSLRFRIKQAGSSVVNLANVSPGIEVVRNGQNVQVNFSNGGATVVGTGGPPANFQIRANKLFIEKGKVGCMPITVKGFKDIVSLSYVMHWDTAVLRYQSTGAYNLPFLDASTFSVQPPNSNNLILSWYDQNVTGVTRPDGAAIYEVCFRAIGPVGSYSVITIDAKGFPPSGGTQEEAIDKNSKNVWEPGTAVRDTIFVVAPPPDSNSVHFIAEKDTIVKGNSGCVDIRVKNFKDISSIQLGITYNPSLLQLNPPIQFGSNPLGLNASMFNTNPPGEVRFTWFDPNGIGRTLPDNTIIFSLCFTAVGDTGKTSPVNFVGFSGFPIEVFQDKKGEITPWLINGRVYISALIPPVLQLKPSNAACNGSATGSISAQLIQGGPATNFSWTGPSGNGTTTDTLIKNLLPGTYTITVTVASGLTATGTATVGQPQPISSNATVVNVTCPGGQDGSITLTTSGGNPGYTYDWVGPSYTNKTTSPSITGLAAGAYSVTISDTKGCTHTLSGVQVAAPAQIQITQSLVVINPVSCHGGNNGSIALPNPTGGTGAHTFSWSGPGGFTATTKNISGLVAGTYTLTVRDANQCSRSFNYEVTQPQSPLSVTLSGTPTPATCFGTNNGSAAVTIAGGTSPYNVQWRLGTQTVSTSLNPNNLAPGSYTVIATDARNCSATLSTPVVVGGPTAAISANPTVQHVKCPGGNDGSITLAPSGGNGAPYTVQWPGNQTGTTLQNLSGGSYIPTITDSKGCTVEAPPIVVNVPQPISVSSVDIKPQDGLTLGSITLNNVSGGTAPLSFRWKGPNNFTSNQQNISGLSYGTYSLTITDANNCTATFTYEVPTTNILIGATVSNIQGACNNDGCITINIPAGAVPPVSIMLSKLPPNPSNQTIFPNKDTFQICNLPSGQYEVGLADGAGNNFVLKDIVITQREPAVVGSSFTPPFDDMKNGVITLTPIPSNANLIYRWQHGPTTPVVNNLDSGTYVVTVTNVNSGCTSVYNFVLVRTYASFECKVVQITPATCANGSNGAAIISVTGGDGPTYQFQWSGPGGFSATMQNLTQVPPGVYTCTVIDESKVARQCPTVTIPSLSQVTVANVNVLSNYNGFAVSGATVCDGVASVVVNGHVGNFTVSWNNGVNTPINNRLCGGPYSVTVTDSLGCTATWQGNLTFPPSIVGSSVTQSNYNGFGVSCDGHCDGRVSVSAVGGVPPYRIQWPTGQVDVNVPLGGFSTATQLCGGEHRVTITDANKVQSILTFTVTEPAPLEFQYSFLPPENFSLCDGEVIALVSAGIPPLSFTWSSLTTGKKGNEARAENLCPGELLEFIVKDANGCLATGRARVPYPPDGCFLVRPVITPAGSDGQNDYALITCIEDYPVNTFEVYNRWGQLVYQVEGYDNNTKRWEGRTSKGAVLPEGVYYYVLKVLIQNEPHEFKGSINLIR